MYSIQNMSMEGLNLFVLKDEVSKDINYLDFDKLQMFISQSGFNNEQIIKINNNLLKFEMLLLDIDKHSIYKPRKKFKEHETIMFHTQLNEALEKNQNEVDYANESINAMYEVIARSEDEVNK